LVATGIQGREAYARGVWWSLSSRPEGVPVVDRLAAADYERRLELDAACAAFRT